MNYISDKTREKLIRENGDAATLFGSNPVPLKPNTGMDASDKDTENKAVLDDPMSRLKSFVTERELLVEKIMEICPAPASECMQCIFGSMPSFILNNYSCQFPEELI